MKQTRSLMGMHVTIEIIDKHVRQNQIHEVFDLFDTIDKQFSPYKTTSEVTKINGGRLLPHQYSIAMREVFALSEQTKYESLGYFDIYKNGTLDPSGLVKGWAIWKAAKMIKAMGFENYFVDAGGDVQVSGRNASGGLWTVGIQNPFHMNQIVKVVALHYEGIATSGTAIRGQHIYNPYHPNTPIHDIVSLTVIGKNIYEADRFATAAFAMGREGIYFIENLAGLEGYMIDKNGIATYTSGFQNYALINRHEGNITPLLGY